MDKKICWGVKIANAKDLKEKIDLTNEALTHYERKLSVFLETEGVAKPDMAFVSAAAAKISEMFYNMLDDEAKEFYGALVAATKLEAQNTTVKKAVNDNGEYD